LAGIADCEQNHTLQTTDVLEGSSFLAFYSTKFPQEPMLHKRFGIGFPQLDTNMSRPVSLSRAIVSRLRVISARP
jgi:hypothetical protein